MFVLNPGSLFTLLSEFILLLLLGALIALLALSGRAHVRAHPDALAIAGVIVLYWGARSWARRPAKTSRGEVYIRAASLLMVGALIIAAALRPSPGSVWLLAIAGGVLVARGLAGAALVILENRAR